MKNSILSDNFFSHSTGLLSNSSPLKSLIFFIYYIFNISSTILPRWFTQSVTNFTLLQHTIVEIDSLITTATVSLGDAYMYIPYLTMPLKTKNLMKLRHSIHQENNHNIFYQVIYHRFRINIQSPLIPRDRFLNITVDNTIYALSFRGIDTTATTHIIHLLFNLYPGFSHLRHTYDGKYYN